MCRREREAAQEAEEARRHEAIKAVNKKTAEDLAGQIKERAVQREAQRRAELEEAKARVNKVCVCVGGGGGWGAGGGAGGGHAGVGLLKWNSSLAACSPTGMAHMQAAYWVY